MAHDAQMAAGGATTSFDCVCVGISIKHPERREIFRPMIDAVRAARDHGMLRADHIVHLRCEVTDEAVVALFDAVADHARSEEHTSELQSLMSISYAVFCLKKQTTTRTH